MTPSSHFWYRSRLKFEFPQGSVIFTGRGAPKNWGDQVLFLRSKGDQMIFQIKKGGSHIFFKEIKYFC